MRNFRRAAQLLFSADARHEFYVGKVQQANRALDSALKSPANPAAGVLEPASSALLWARKTEGRDPLLALGTYTHVAFATQNLRDGANTTTRECAVDKIIGLVPRIENAHPTQASAALFQVMQSTTNANQLAQAAVLLGSVIPKAKAQAHTPS